MSPTLLTVDFLANHPLPGIRASGERWPEPMVESIRSTEYTEILCRVFNREQGRSAPACKLTRHHRSGIMADTIHVSGTLVMYNHTRIVFIRQRGAELEIEHAKTTLEIDRHHPTFFRIYRDPTSVPCDNPDRVEWNAPEAGNYVDVEVSGIEQLPDHPPPSKDYITLLEDYPAVGHYLLSPPVSLDLAHTWKIEAELDSFALVTPEGRYPLWFSRNDWTPSAHSCLWQDHAGEIASWGSDSKIFLQAE